MLRCANCNGPLQDDTEVCSFCGTLTPVGVTAKQRRLARDDIEQRSARQRQVVEGEAAKARAHLDIEKVGKTAMIASLVGIVACCVLPIGPAIGIVLGSRARRVAKQHGLHNTGNATLGLTVGWLGVALAASLWVLMVVLSVQENNRKALLRSQLTDVSAASLGLPTACALVELELIDLKFQGFASYDEYVCQATGSVTQNGDAAELRDTSFTKDSKKIQVVGCFVRHGGRWSLKKVDPLGECSGGPKPSSD